MSDFGTTSFHRGYKDHQCEWCPEIIPQGEQFAHFIGKWDGDFQDWRMHLECYMAYRDADLNEEGFYPHEHKRGSAEDR